MKKKLHLEFRGNTKDGIRCRIIEQSHRGKEFGNVFDEDSMMEETKFVASNGFTLYSRGRFYTEGGYNEIFLPGNSEEGNNTYRYIPFWKITHLIKAVKEYNEYEFEDTQHRAVTIKGKVYSEDTIHNALKEYIGE